MHGNKGSIDGDSPAAMRYTETRLAEISKYLLRYRHYFVAIIYETPCTGTASEFQIQI